MKASGWLCLTLLLVPLVLAGCKEAATDKKASAARADKEYGVKGKVVAVAPDKTSVTLDHEDIPGLMKGMKMKFRVEDPKVLEGIQPGDPVQGKLKVESGNYTVTRLEKR